LLRAEDRGSARVIAEHFRRRTMCKPNGKAGIPAACPRRGDCRGCAMLLSALAGEGSPSRLDALVKEGRPPPASENRS